MSGNIAFNAIAQKSALFEALALQNWEDPEIAFDEVNACRRTAELAAELGFSVQTPVYGMPTALRACWGSGGPVIGFLGELDALPGLSQKVGAVQEPAQPGGPGQGCGHNLLCVAPLAAAYGLKEELRQRNIQATVVYYGCPAEERLTGKGFMARGGAFRELDIAFSWHGSSVNSVSVGRSAGLNSAVFHFHGRTAHAGGDPHNGRSALDAVELMNVGANYLREHVTPDTRIHYVITDGGTAPNIVPDRAAVWYYVRALSRESIEDTYRRLVGVAEGAAKMTGTSVEVEYLGGCYETMPNHVLTGLLHQCLLDSGLPEWTEEELRFADALNRNSPHYNPAVHKTPLCTEVLPIGSRDGSASTDVAEVMHIVPCASANTVMSNLASGGHSWQVTACCGSSIGIKGMLYGARTLALAAVRAVEQPDIIRAAKAEFAASMGEKVYQCPIPDDLPVPQPRPRP